jgi:hypothetical protein
MPITPVPDYDGARYPTLDDVAAERRAFLRQVGLAAIAASFGPAALAGTPTPPPPMPAGTPVPARWPGPRGALIGGRSIEVTYRDGSKGRVAVAAVFSADNAALEGALIDAQSKIATAVRARLAEEPPNFTDDSARVARVEAALLGAIRKIVAVPGLQSVSIARVAGAVSRVEDKSAPAPAPARAVQMPPAAPMAPPASAAPPEPRRLPRAGAKCPIHGSGCTASAHGG